MSNSIKRPMFFSKLDKNTYSSLKSVRSMVVLASFILMDTMPSFLTEAMNLFLICFFAHIGMRSWLTGIYGCLVPIVCQKRHCSMSEQITPITALNTCFLHVSTINNKKMLRVANSIIHCLARC